MNFRCIALFAVCITLLLFASGGVEAADINFNGKLGSIQLDNGGGVYAGVSLGTDFTGRIDDNGGGGFISDGTTRTPFTCCISAGNVSVTNDKVITAEEATFLNEIAGSTRYSAGDIIDLVNIEGDERTADGGRIEIGISYQLPANTFNNADLDNYPVNQDDIELALFFIFESDSGGEDIYSAGGKITSPQTPTCADIAGQWQGNWSETSCDANTYSDTWTGTVSSDCTFTGTDNWDRVSGTINPTTMALTARGISEDGCGTISVTGTFANDAVSGSYTYSVGGRGTFSGNRQGDNNGGGSGGGGGGGGGGCFIRMLIN